jgi:predicted RNA-binding protein YlxR (DUF448 family)
MRRKHLPRRTCVACREIGSKRELVRIVRRPEGGVVVDPTGKLAGRGAYLCKAKACWTKALKGRQLEHALKTTISDEDRESLEAYASGLPD